MEKESKKIILNSALKIIEEEGFQKLTVRKIAEKSGKNINAINYYYGSKEKMEIEIIKSFFDKVYGECFNSEMEKFSMEEFLNRYCIMMIKNRELFKKIFTCLISDNMETVSEISKYVKGKISATVKQMEDIQFDSCEERMLYFQKMAAVIYPVLITEGVENMFGFNIEDENIRKEYIRVLLRRN